MPSLKRPELPEGPKKELNDALHDLHWQAGQPSVRDLVGLVGGKVVAGRSRIHDAFCSDRLPAWGLIQILTEALASKIPGAEPAIEELRLHQLWLAASGHSTPHEATQQSASEMVIPSQELPWEIARPVLTMRVEWAHPAELKVDIRRGLRAWVDKALDDIGWPSYGDHRRNGSAGSSIILDDLTEPPTLTVGTFLATLDAEVNVLHSQYRHRHAPPINLRFMASYDPLTPGPAGSAHGLMDDLNAIWSTDIIAEVSSATAEYVSAVLCGMDVREGNIAGVWKHHSEDVDFTSGRRSVPFYYRTADSGDPWAPAF